MCGFIMVSYDSKIDFVSSVHTGISVLLVIWDVGQTYETLAYPETILNLFTNRAAEKSSANVAYKSSYGLGIRFQFSSQHLTWQYNRFFSLFPHAQVYRMYFLSFCGIVLWRRPSVTWRVIQRASYCAATMTAGAAAPQSSLIVTAPSQTSKPWRRVCVRAKSPGPTSTMTSWTQVG